MLTNLIRWQQRRTAKKYLTGSLYKRLRFLILFLVILCVANSIVLEITDKIAFTDALWLSVTTITTVGYGDFSPSTTIGRISTFISLYSFGIVFLSIIIGEVIEWHSDRRERMRNGDWEWKGMQDHILIINTPNNNTDIYLDRLVNEIRKTPELSEGVIQIVTRKYPDGLPESLRSHKVIHTNGVAENSDVLRSVNVEHATTIIILSRDENDSVSDSLTFDVLSRIQEIGTKALVLAECANDDNRERLVRAGANAVIRPVRAYPELLVRAVSSPGTESVMENLFSHEGEHLERFDIPFSVDSWSKLVCKMAENNIGLPMGYIDDGNVITNPPMMEKCTGAGIILMVDSSNLVTLNDVSRALAL
ncbi:MAG: voltage-gated potassium channel [Flavobacteriales bacterium]|jgi:voltage-gated potassium channel